MSLDHKRKKMMGLVKKRSLSVLDQIINEDESMVDQINKIDRDLLVIYEPTNFIGHEGAEVQMALSFEGSIMALQGSHYREVKDMTAFEFITACNLVKQQNK